MTNRQLLEKFFAAENARDWTAFKGYLHPEVMWFLHAEDNHTAVAGREEYMDMILTGYTDDVADTYVCESMEVSQSGNRITALLKSTTGERSMNIFDFEDGLIRWEHEFLLGG